MTPVYTGGLIMCEAHIKTYSKAVNTADAQSQVILKNSPIFGIDCLRQKQSIAKISNVADCAVACIGEG